MSLRLNMCKKTWLLFIFSVFVVNNSEALCCFSKKAVERPAQAQIAPTAAPVATQPPEDPDAATLETIESTLENIKKANCKIEYWDKRIKAFGSAIGRKRLDHYRMAKSKKENACAEQQILQFDLKKLVKNLRKNENYQNFIECFHRDVFYKSHGNFYADDKKLQERDLEVILPFPEPLIGIVSGYLWRHGNLMEVHSLDNDFVDSISIFDAQNNQHMLTSPQSRTVFGRISSLRVMPYPHLLGIALLQDYILKERPQDPEGQDAEDSELKRLVQEGAITGLTSHYAKERQLLLVPGPNR